ncbi:MAG: hypothetical protein Q9M91_05435 [Candidatus Dojkabacteria bacterium]|nr:hypothetical protein [Candidatus Dojkabacteria bacterium]
MAEIELVKICEITPTQLGAIYPAYDPNGVAANNLRRYVCGGESILVVFKAKENLPDDFNLAEVITMIKGPTLARRLNVTRAAKQAYIEENGIRGLIPIPGSKYRYKGVFKKTSARKKGIEAEWTKFTKSE